MDPTLYIKSRLASIKPCFNSGRQSNRHARDGLRSASWSCLVPNQETIAKARWEIEPAQKVDWPEPKWTFWIRPSYSRFLYRNLTANQPKFGPIFPGLQECVEGDKGSGNELQTRPRRWVDIWDGQHAIKLAREAWNTTISGEQISGEVPKGVRARVNRKMKEVKHEKSEVP